MGKEEEVREEDTPQEGQPVQDENNEQEEKTSVEVVEEDEVDEESGLEKAIERLKDDLKMAEGECLRAKAEMMNFRKRQEKEKSVWNQICIRDIISSLLDPFDNLERAVEVSEDQETELSAEDQFKSLAEGVKMVISQFHEVLDKKKVVQLDPHGEEFNPNEQEAFGHIETDEVEEGCVAAVYRKGYKVENTLIRTAQVQVAKQPAESDED